LDEGLALSQGHYLHRTTQTQAYIHASSEIRTQDPNIRVSEAVSCCRPRSYCDQHQLKLRVHILLYVWVLTSLWLSKEILFLQENAAPHKAVITHHKLTDLHFEVLKHPAYSLDLAPSDYYLCPNLFIKPKTYQPYKVIHTVHKHMCNFCI
jgi:hypothetical protein